MPTLFRRSNGVYYLVLHDQNGKRRWTSTGETTKSAAVRKVASIHLPSKGKARLVPLSDFVKQFINFAPTIYAPGTVDIYSKSLNSFLRCVGNMELHQISGREIDRYKQFRSKEISPTTLNIDLRTLRAAFSRAVRWNFIQSNPFKQVPLCNIPEKSPTYFTVREIRSILSSVKERWLKSIILFAAHTGMRREEIVNLKWTDVDLKAKLIRIESNSAYRTKTGKRRVVPMNTVVCRLLKKLQKIAPTDHVFVLDNRKVRQVWVTRRFKQYLRRLKFPESYHFHTLRHTFASWLVQRGAPIYEVQRLLGHSSLRVTEIYSHLIPSQLRDTVEIIVNAKHRQR